MVLKTETLKMSPQKGLLVRVGIDQTYGKYNAPINPHSNDYVYMPIPQSNAEFIAGLDTTYDTLEPFFNAWCHRNGTSIQFPNHLKNEKGCHLDPDFDFLTYGDQAYGRGLRIAALKENDFIAFFASFNPVHQCEHRLVYALYGIMVVDKILRVADVDQTDFHKNAHTRLVDMNKNHLVVFAKTAVSGRFNRAIPIGEFRNGAYRVTEKTLEEWGGLGVKDGFIQRSVCPPWFIKPEQFLLWLNKKEVSLINRNWM